MRRICIVVTARPSYSRVKTVLKALRARPDVDLQIVACASAVVTRYGRIVDQIQDDGFFVTERVSSVVEDDSLANSALSTGLLLTQLAGVFERLRPDVVVTIADRHETLATAIAASYQNIPLAHIQGGETTGSIDNKVRHAITQLADSHFVSTAAAAACIHQRRPSKIPQWIYVTGCPGVDMAAEARDLGAIHQAETIVLQHSVTNQASLAGAQMRATIEAVGEDALYLWPGEDAGGQAMAKQLRIANIKPVRNVPPVEFLRTLLGAKVLVGNSSVGIRECSFLGVPVVNIGDRQANRERGGNVLDVPHDVEAIRAAIRLQRNAGRYAASTLYADGHAGERIAALLAGDEASEVAA